MAKRRKKSTRRKPARRRRRVGGMSGKLQNRKVSANLFDILYVVGGAVLNHVVINPALNKLNEKMQKEDGTPMLGEHQGKIITAAKAVGSTVLAFAVKMPQPARLTFIGTGIASGVELAAQFIPEKMTAVAGTGDLFGQIGATAMIEIPVNQKALSGAMDETAVYGLEDTAVMNGTGDVFQGSGDLIY